MWNVERELVIGAQTLENGRKPKHWHEHLAFVKKMPRDLFTDCNTITLPGSWCAESHHI